MNSVFILVIILLAAGASTIRLHVALAFDAGAAPAFEAAVAEEAARVWAPYGIVLDGSQGQSMCQSGTITLQVSVIQRAVPGTSDDSLGRLGWRTTGRHPPTAAGPRVRSTTMSFVPRAGFD